MHKIANFSSRCRAFCWTRYSGLAWRCAGSHLRRELCALVLPRLPGCARARAAPGTSARVCPAQGRPANRRVRMHCFRMPTFPLLPTVDFIPCRIECVHVVESRFIILLACITIKSERKSTYNICRGLEAQQQQWHCCLLLAVMELVSDNDKYSAFLYGSTIN